MSESRAKGRKIGRNTVKCARYLSLNRRNVNKTRRAATRKAKLVRASERRMELIAAGGERGSNARIQQEKILAKRKSRGQSTTKGVK